MKLDAHRRYPVSRELSRRAQRLVPGGSHTYAQGNGQFPEQTPVEGRSVQPVDRERG